MAGDRDLLNRLAKALVAFDDATLAAIASFGLVRRARKDLEKETIAVEAGEASVRIRVGDGDVTMTESGPADARCTCLAGGKCRHVLVATMYLKEKLAPAEPPQSSPAGATPAPSAREELLALTEQSLAKWVSRKTLREALRLVEEISDLEIVEDAAVTVRFPSSSIECRYFPGTGLAGMVTTAPHKLRERFMAAAILGYQKHHGMVHEIELLAPSAKPIDAPRTSEEILQSASALLEEIVTIGIARVSGSVRDRLQTLSVSCVGGNLARLSLLLKSLADEVSMLLRRDAASDDARLFNTLARTYALCNAIARAGESASPSLIGRGRSRYDQTGAMELAGIGAYAWRTRSGYHGLTVIFWDSAGKQFCTWSDSRPVAQDPWFNPLARYEQDLHWQGSANARIMSRSQFRLSGASRNDEGRLSGSEKCQAVVLGDTDPAAIDFGPRAFEDWSELRRYLASVTPAGLEEHSPLDRVVLLKPTTWGPRAFSATEQTLMWALLDRQGQPILLTVPFDAISQRAVTSLEAIGPADDPPWAILGSVSFDGAQLRLFPYSLLRRAEGTRISNLNLDASPRADDPAPAPASGAAPEVAPRPPMPNSAAPRTPMPDSADEAQTSGAELTPIFARWARLEDNLHRWAETGVRRIRPEELTRLPSTMTDFTDRGLTPIALCFRQGIESQAPAATVLRLRYLCMLYRELAIRLRCMS